MSAAEEPVTFGALIRHARKARCVTQTQLWRAIGRSSAYMCRVESGHLPPPPRAHCDTIARILSLDPEELWRIAAFERDPDVFKAGFRAGRITRHPELEEAG